MYVDSILDKKKNVVKVVERVDGNRVYKEYPCEWLFYYDDFKGKHQTIFRTPVSKFTTPDYKQFQRELKIHSNKKLWESDINQVNKTLAEYYIGKNAPKLNVCFFDIEVDFHPTMGFAPTTDPFNKITAISLYNTWMDELITLVIPPRTWTIEQANELAATYDNCYMFEDEADMLNTFLSLIDDADVISGWNSEGYDIPYTIKRIERILSKNDTRRMCLWDQLPKFREFEKYGKQQFTYDLRGRVHLDSLSLYQQYTYHEMHSYSLDAISEYELGDKKVAYEGSLDQLYNNDFPKFVDYNRQDTMLLKKLDDKLQFIDLANTLAHDNTVLLPSTMGAVAVTEQAIINYAHDLGLIVPNKTKADESHNLGAAGAFVATPKHGRHKWVGAIDINSLYPSAIRALNMSPETIVGQLRPDHTADMILAKMARMDGKKGKTFAGAWEGVFGSLEYQYVQDQDIGKSIKIDWANGDVSEHSAAEIYKLVYTSGQPWIMSANGTIFDATTKGIVPGILEKWYADRQEMQATMKTCEGEERSFWDKRQLVKKINLNSLYGAILNKHCRFYVFDIGQSTTLTGRCITKHMSAFVNQAFTGEYSHTGDSIVYGDTDSVYFSAYPPLQDEIKNGMEWNEDICIELYNQVSNAVNESFPEYMNKAFHCPQSHGEIIQGGLELIASSGLFIKKKRYGLMIFDDDGVRKDVDGKPGKVKAMGMDLKRSDTPGFMQEFLMKLLIDVLVDESEQSIIDKIVEFKHDFNKRPSWEKGTPKRVNKLTHYTAVFNDKAGNKGVTVPGHVAGAIAWNKLRKFNSDNYSMEIQDGQKTIVCKLKDNPLGYKSVSYPIDENNLPEWFKELPFDDELMLNTIVDKKVDNLLGVLKWDLEGQTDISSTFNDLFSFE